MYFNLSYQGKKTTDFYRFLTLFNLGEKKNQSPNQPTVLPWALTCVATGVLQYFTKSQNVVSQEKHTCPLSGKDD